MSGQDEGVVGRYRIGTASQLSGLPPDTIRAWERRHGVVDPARSEGGTRLYSDDDVARLQLLAALTEFGESIGDVAPLSDEQLRERLVRHGDAAAGNAGYVPDAEGRRLAVLDVDLVEQLRANPTGLIDIELVAAEVTLDRFLERVAEKGADVIVVHDDQLGRDAVRGLERCMQGAGAQTAVVVYAYCTRQRLARLSDMGVRLVKAPLRVSGLRRNVLDFIAINRARGVHEGSLGFEAPIDVRAAAPARQFSDARLARLREVRSSIDCECPNHLSGIIMSLIAFEKYSLACESDNPDDAALHALLARGTGHARAAIEQLLERLIEHDGLQI